MQVELDKGEKRRVAEAQQDDRHAAAEKAGEVLPSRAALRDRLQARVDEKGELGEEATPPAPSTGHGLGRQGIATAAADKRQRREQEDWPASEDDEDEDGQRDRSRMPGHHRRPAGGGRAHAAAKAGRDLVEAARLDQTPQVESSSGETGTAGSEVRSTQARETVAGQEAAEASQGSQATRLKEEADRLRERGRKQAAQDEEDRLQGRRTRDKLLAAVERCGADTKEKAAAAVEVEVRTARG